MRKRCARAIRKRVSYQIVKALWTLGD